MRWQKRARFGVALFGIGFAVLLYFAIGERQQAAPAARPARLDPKAILESAGAILQQFREAKQDYEITAERQLTYEGGATRLVGVTIKVRGKEGRDFTVTGREASASEGQQELQITGGVKLMASDGFVISAASATFKEADATVHVPGTVEFEKGGMSGSGVGMTYDQNGDVLTLQEKAHVEVVDQAGNTTTDFTAGSATLDRQQNFLALDGSMHVLRGEQVLEADRGLARLTEDENAITFIELRGSSRVVGGGAFDSMTARDIDLDYTDDGEILERVTLTGDGAIAMPGGEGGTGRQFAGDSLNVAFAPDNSVTSVVGRQHVRLDLPAAPDQPARSVRARAMDAGGESGKGLTAATFTDDVEYREEARRGGAARVATSRALQVTLDGDSIGSATFTGNVRFEEQGLEASGATAQYDPSQGALRLSGGRPTLADDRITIEADAIDVMLEGRRMVATGTLAAPVKTTLRPRPPGGSRLPGLLEDGQPANVNATQLDYRGEGGTATYTGDAVLWQGETAIRGAAIIIDQTSGDLLATGDARANLVLDMETSIGRGPQIRYDDNERRVTFGAPPPSAGAPAVAMPLSLLNGPQGNLQAERIELILPEKGGGRAERLEAYQKVSARVDTRVATGDRLTFFTDDERYLMTGIATVPVQIVDGCRTTTGRSVTFFKSTARIIVDGKEEIRTQSVRGAGCSQPAR
jgi:lipopolysaccharide export system protein LptA